MKKQSLKEESKDIYKLKTNSTVKTCYKKILKKNLIDWKKTENKLNSSGCDLYSSRTKDWEELRQEFDSDFEMENVYILFKNKTKLKKKKKIDDYGK